MRRAAPLLLLLAPLFGGCVAAAAVPLLAGGLVAREQVDRPEPQTPAAPDSERVAVFATSPVFNTGLASNSVSAPAGRAATAVEPRPPVAAPRAHAAGAIVVNTMPAPAQVMAAPRVAPVTASTISAIGSATPAAADIWAAFARYAIGRAPPPPPGLARRSAVVDQATIAGAPKLEQCGRQPPAVVIDLDPGQEAIDLGDPPTPAPGLADALESLRKTGVTVLWLTAHPISQEDRIRRLLRAVELDEGGVDKLLLLRTPSERKQSRRLAATRDWCILAVAGDRRGDFDEMFDYLLDSSGPTAAALEPVFGDGWFLAPPPIG